MMSQSQPTRLRLFLLISLVCLGYLLLLSPEHQPYASMSHRGREYRNVEEWVRQVERELQGGDDTTILPTLILTPSPTSPTGEPSVHPSTFPSVFSDEPSEFPSVSPSTHPTKSYEPSESPSISGQPTLSMAPSESPSDIPSAQPTLNPSSFPSQMPSLSPSALPSPPPSAAPTVSEMPSQLPSYGPTNYPTTSYQPSFRPTVTPSPTVTPRPTGRPSFHPTQFPTYSPSSVPTPLPPTHRPSFSPTQIPSVEPSSIPSTIPTMYPTLSVAPLYAPSITMTIEGLPKPLDSLQQEKWQNITDKHIFDYYQKYNEVGPGLIPVNVSSVNTTFMQQTFRQTDGVLEIKYEQTIVLGRYRPVEDEDLLFVIPFLDNTQDYVIELLSGLDLDNIIILKSVVVGEGGDGGHSPTKEPSPTPESEGISAAALTGISVSIVLAACLMVVFLFWGRKRKSEVAAQGENSEYREGVQSDSDDGWRNSEMATPPRPGYSSAPSTPQLPIGFQGTLQSDVTASMRSDENSHLFTENGHHRQTSRNNSRGGNLPTIAMRPSFFGRNGNQSRAESEITDSEGGPPSDASDSGFVLEPPTLPAISDNSERFRPAESAEPSPLYIPDDEEGMQGAYPPEGSQILGLSRSHSSPSLRGFDMMISELE